MSGSNGVKDCMSEGATRPARRRAQIGRGVWALAAGAALTVVASAFYGCSSDGAEPSDGGGIAVDEGGVRPSGDGGSPDGARGQVGDASRVGDAATGTAWLRVVNFTSYNEGNSVGLPGPFSVKVYIEGQAEPLVPPALSQSDVATDQVAPGVSGYVQVPAGINVSLVAIYPIAGTDKDGGNFLAEGSGRAVQVFEPDARYTLFALGPGFGGVSVSIEKETLTAPPSGSVTVAPVVDPGLFPFALGGDDHRVFSVADDEGFGAPGGDPMLLITSRLTSFPVNGDPPARFTLPTGTLSPGGEYYVVRRTISDALLFVPAHEPVTAPPHPVLVLADPQVTFFGVLEGAVAGAKAPPSDPPLLDVYVDGKKVAAKVHYGAGKDDGNGNAESTLVTLPLSPGDGSAANLVFRDATKPTAPPLLTASPGPLMAGSSYFGILSGRVGSATPPKFTAYEAAPHGSARYIDVSIGSATPIDVGYFNVTDNATSGFVRGTTFTAAATGLSYGSASPAAGVLNTFPFTRDGSSNFFPGVRRGRVVLPARQFSFSAPPHPLVKFVVVFGDWSAKTQSFAVQAPQNDSFSDPSYCSPSSIRLDSSFGCFF